jgi:hypothetical protein
MISRTPIVVADSHPHHRPFAGQPEAHMEARE